MLTDIYQPLSRSHSRGMFVSHATSGACMQGQQALFYPLGWLCLILSKRLRAGPLSIMNYERERRAAHRGGEVGFRGILNSPFSWLHSYIMITLKSQRYHMIWRVTHSCKKAMQKSQRKSDNHFRQYMKYEVYRPKSMSSPWGVHTQWLVEICVRWEQLAWSC